MDSETRHSVPDWMQKRQQQGGVRRERREGKLDGGCHSLRKRTQEEMCFPLCGCWPQEDQEFNREHEITEHILSAYCMPVPG